ncbi:hypothetical protein GALMADRAFT_208862 [Galerina marginata CBS 339.88]|uniref:Uncharacterized protein n=1 Tax=Galerina marginata (strain CBS 339.88) TaxID=685588 RepID=A0A067TKP4_GALM3|nr:hypothetical protein GALMADRAFT_208862 [Galerina marginata CBS 339.88]
MVHGLQTNPTKILNVWMPKKMQREKARTELKCGISCGCGDEYGAAHKYYGRNAEELLTLLWKAQRNFLECQLVFRPSLVERSVVATFIPVRALNQDSMFHNDHLDPYGPPPPSAYVPVDPFKPSIAFSLKNVFRRGGGEEPLCLDNQVDAPQPFRIMKSARTRVGLGEKQGYRPERLGNATLEAGSGTKGEAYGPPRAAAYPRRRFPTPPPKRRKRRPGVVFDVPAPHEDPPLVSHPSAATQAPGPAILDVAAPQQHPPPPSSPSDVLEGDGDAMSGRGRPSWYRPSRYTQALEPAVHTAGDEENQMPPLVDANSEPNVSQSQDREPRPRPTIYPASLRSSSTRRLDSSIWGRHDFSDDSPYALIPPESWAVPSENPLRCISSVGFLKVAIASEDNHAGVVGR